MSEVEITCFHSPTTNVKAENCVKQRSERTQDLIFNIARGFPPCQAVNKADDPVHPFLTWGMIYFLTQRRVLAGMNYDVVILER